MRLARFLGAAGRTFIAVGVLLLLFVAYQLWGTGIQQARAQDRLGSEFEAALEAVDVAPEGEGDEPAHAPPPPPPALGDAVAQIEIPRIGVKEYVVEGVGVADLKKGPGHYPLTPLPGQPGNAAIAGHRTTYGAPFYDLDELEDGDEIFVRTVEGEFTYVVDSQQVVQPHQTEVLAPTDDARLTLTTCEPRYSARRRLIVTAVLASEPTPTTTTTTATTHPAPRGEDDGAAGEGAAFDDGAGLSGDPAARWPALWWGALTALVGIVAWRFATRFRARRWWVYLAAAPVFLVTLFVFYENVARLLPANI